MPQCHILKKCTHTTKQNSKRQCVQLLQMLRLLWVVVKISQPFSANVISVPVWWKSVNVGSILQFQKFLAVSTIKMKWFRQAQTHTGLRVGQNCPILFVKSYFQNNCSQTEGSEKFHITLSKNIYFLPATAILSYQNNNEFSEIIWKPLHASSFVIIWF